MFGLFVGMGVGFLLDSLIRLEDTKVQVRFPLKVGGLTILIVGLLFILGGCLVLFSSELLSSLIPYLIGLGMITIGVYFLMAGTSLFRKSVS